MDHEYTKLLVARAKVEKLRIDSDECVGQLAHRTDERQTVEVIEPDDLAGGDPTQPPPTADVVLRPPSASPTQ